MKRKWNIKMVSYIYDKRKDTKYALYNKLVLHKGFHDVTTHDLYFTLTLFSSLIVLRNQILKMQVLITL
jgi:hypothetical protein